MASFVEWRSRLCSAFERFNANNSDSNGCKNILQVKDGVLYVWNESDQSVNSLKLSDSSEDDAVAFQCFVPSTPPVYEIESLVCNPSGQRLALVGRSGINVVEFPRHQRPALATLTPPHPVGSSTVRLLASSTEIAERFFLCNRNCHVLQVEWHPGSDTSTHLVALFSNNYIRVYDCCSPSTAVQVCQLGQVPVFRLSRTSANSFGSVLGDTVVGFDFGRPVRAADHFDNKTLSYDGALDPDDLVWPVFLVRGNGDVYAMWATNPKHSDLKSELRGPLTMHPPADDNYGVDACSIVCLPCVPAVLVIATCSGMLYHCIVLESDVDQCPTLDVSWRSSSHVRTLSPPNVSLYVYESVELQVVLASSALDYTDHEQDAGYPIRLCRDPTTTNRYHCSSATGVHTVALPLIPQLEFYANHIEVSATDDDALSCIEHQNAIVEHLICTKPLANSPTAPIIGLAVAYGHALGGATLLCLTSPFDLLALPLVPTYFDSLPPLLLDDEKQKELTTHARAPKEPFDQYIRRLLQRQSSNPLLKSHMSVDPTPQECVHILSKATSVLREGYIKKQDLAKEEIHKRIKGLNSLKSVQLDELKAVIGTKDALTKRAETLAERYEDLQSKQDEIARRVEMVTRALLKHSPVVSDAEQSMRHELSTFKDKMKDLETSIEQIKAKQKYQSDATKNTNRGKRTNEQLLQHTSEMQLSQMKQLLSTETQMLATLSTKMTDVQRNLGV